MKSSALFSPIGYYPIYILITSGWIFQTGLLCYVGSIGFLLLQLRDVIFPLMPQQTMSEFNLSKRRLHKKITEAFGAATLLVALGMMFSDHHASSVAGKILWFGSVALFVLAGFVIEMITGVRLKIGPGGWKPNNRRH